jgi:hypothetical protein
VIAGRRTLEAYLLLFLQALPRAAEHDHSTIAARVLHTHVLGEHVAPHWKLHEVMRWVPPRAGNPGLDGRAAGLYKVAGTTVEATVGGILHQFVSQDFLHRIPLPNDAEADQWTGRKSCSQVVPYSCASAFIAQGLPIGATRRPSWRCAEGN